MANRKLTIEEGNAMDCLIKNNVKGIIKYSDIIAQSNKKVSFSALCHTLRLFGYKFI